MNVTLTPQQRNRIFAERIDSIADFSRPAAHPWATLVVAQPGAGKSTMTAKTQTVFTPAEKPVVIDYDFFRRWHPNYAEIARADPFKLADATGEDAGFWTRETLRLAAASRKNFILETPLGGVRQPLQVAFALKLKGYHTNLHTLAVPARKSTLGIVTRFETALARGEAARWTDLAMHDERAANLAKRVGRLALSGMFRNVRVFRRNGTELHTGKIGASAAIAREQNHAWSPREIFIQMEAWRDLQTTVNRQAAARPDWYVALVNRHAADAVEHAQHSAPSVPARGTRQWHSADWSASHG